MGKQKGEMYLFGSIGGKDYNTENRECEIPEIEKQRIGQIIIMGSKIGVSSNTVKPNGKNKYIEKLGNGVTVNYTYIDGKNDLEIDWEYQNPKIEKKVSKDKNNQIESNEGYNNEYNKIAIHPVLGKFHYYDLNNAQQEIKIEKEWIDDNIIAINIPQEIRKKKVFGKVIYINKNTKKQWEMVIKILFENKDLLALIEQLEGTFYARYMRGSKTNISLHSWGIAVDINSPSYPMGKECTNKNSPNWILWEKVFKPSGFFWGNDFKKSSRKDPMHFEVHF